MPDPKLKKAAEEIKSILRKHDIAGVVVLASASHMEFVRHLEADWLALKIEVVNGKTAVRFRCKRADYPTKEAWEKQMKDTIGTLIGFLDCWRNDVEAFDFLLKTVAQKVKIEHMTKLEDPNL